MIKTYCDFCGEEIKGVDMQVNLDWNAFGGSGFECDENNFHMECATRIRNIIREHLKGGEGDG